MKSGMRNAAKYMSSWALAPNFEARMAFRRIPKSPANALVRATTKTPPSIVFDSWFKIFGRGGKFI
jgi:hypothetical protein